MPIETYWYDVEHTIIYRRIYGRWTLQDIMDAFASADYLIDEGAIPDVFIWDFSAADEAPSGILRLSSFFAENTLSDPNYHLLLVAPSRFVRILAGVMRFLPTYRVTIVDTLAEMQARLDQSLTIAPSVEHSENRSPEA